MCNSQHLAHGTGAGTGTGAVEPHMSRKADVGHGSEDEVACLRVQDLQLRDVIGTGATSVVRLATVTAELRGRSKWLAVKIIEKKRLRSSKQRDRVFAEKQALLQLAGHPRIVTLHGTDQDLHCLYFLLDCATGGPLHRHLRAATRFSEEQTRFYAVQLAEALAGCHAADIIYRDLKLSNVLLDGRGNLVLTDFGFAKKLRWGEQTLTYCGTPHAMAPEVLSRSEYGRAADWWSFGIAVYEMLMGKPPAGYEHTELLQVAALGGHAEAPFPESVFSQDEMRALVRQCLVVAPAERLGGGRADGVADARANAWLAPMWQGVVDGTIPPPSFDASLGVELTSNEEQLGRLTSQQQELFADF